MFSKILIANRGEIACRIIRACREMKIATVAVYSDADQDALHVRMADEAFNIGPPPSSQSYLLGEKIIDTARVSGAEAIHPGYGFLSENAHFVRQVNDSGITFIGPPPEAMEGMGGKMSARKIAVEAGVPIVPGTTEPLRSIDEARSTASDIGYPIMLKASAGGGGKGMRIARSAGGTQAISAASNSSPNATAIGRADIRRACCSARMSIRLNSLLPYRSMAARCVATYYGGSTIPISIRGARCSRPPEDPMHGNSEDSSGKVGPADPEAFAKNLARLVEEGTLDLLAAPDRRIELPLGRELREHFPGVPMSALTASASPQMMGGPAMAANASGAPSAAARN